MSDRAVMVMAGVLAFLAVVVVVSIGASVAVLTAR